MKGSAELTKAPRCFGIKTISNLGRHQQGPVCSPPHFIGRENHIVVILVSFKVQKAELYIQGLSNSWRVSK